MGANFGALGTGYYTKYGGVAQDCRWDAGCALTSASQGSCSDSSTCKPRKIQGYTGEAFPGELWDDQRGFQDFFKKGSRIELFSEGALISMVSLGESYMKLPRYKEKDTRMLRYTDLRLAKLHRRVEHCTSTFGPGNLSSPGLDCGSPAFTLNMAPHWNEMPFYLSLPHFSTELEPEASHETAPYLPSSRVNITPCFGNAWCNDQSSAKYSSYIWVEPETGKPIVKVEALQGNIRIAAGPRPSIFHPKLHDALLPVYWQREGRNSSLAFQAKLAELQIAPDHLRRNALFFLLPGVFGVAIGSGCIVFALTHKGLKGKSRVASEQFVATRNGTLRRVSNSSNDLIFLPRLHGQAFRKLSGIAEKSDRRISRNEEEEQDDAVRAKSESVDSLM
eukprot:TRINITY_DN81449_c0_g1_i1.p1 TRINITY_DN81449_c0_g1~~TRINITY_DN81449_c0_g1_i1.p1  ORF type:complete len:391 (+),score=44.72 TRINITY_DN81449_c0_g1_i1:93-1265(+)